MSMSPSLLSWRRHCLSKKAAKVKAIRRHIRLEIDESEEKSGGDTLEKTEDEEVECSSSESGDDQEVDQEVDNSALEDIVLAEVSD